ncbi:PREDICTED: arrestin domain-containing protein 3-like [Priapulus caudatus]|uniref:Arrestin domain-containing protein 3-like n=1 Tax=Priapulus caudatus TaxID=37621 RepID=A0ABM1EC17_PRICU|nr:PREDICTED: arrestin domain-containing protein 3-like [Priapulus caudatus]
MGKLEAFQIAFFNTHSQLVPVYYAGQVLSGQVIVELNEPITMRGIKLTLKGTASVHWSERHNTGSGKHRHSHTSHYRNEELYFNHEIMLFSKEPGTSDNPTMPAGRRVFDFSVQLPPHLPSTFEGAHGNVRYSAKACIDRPWKFDHTAKGMFTVVSVMDLNSSPEAASPVSGHNEKYLCCWCCKEGPISCQASIPHMGYVPGENIYVSADIENNTNKGCNYSKAELIAFEISPKGAAFDLNVRIPIIIGSIPLRSVFQGLQAQGQTTFSNTIQPGANYSSGGIMPYTGIGPSKTDAVGGSSAHVVPSAPMMPLAFDSYPDLPPPSYEECVDTTVDVRDEDDSEYTMGELKYTPCYPYYNNIQ